jgi:hypothetical protein
VQEDALRLVMFQQPEKLPYPLVSCIGRQETVQILHGAKIGKKAGAVLR